MISSAKLALAALVLLTSSGCEARGADQSLTSRLEAMAASGNGEAAYHLGMIHHLGLEGTKNPAKALDLFRRAAEAGDPLGAYKLGCFYDGQGEDLVENNPDVALRYKLKAAEAGYSLAQHDAAMLYYNRGEPEKALKWMSKAAAQGYAGSMFALASLYNVGKGIENDRARTYAYFVLFERFSGEALSDQQREWLENYKNEMTGADIERAKQLIDTWQVKPTPLTLKALSGQNAAEELLRSGGNRSS